MKRKALLILTLPLAFSVLLSCSSKKNSSNPSSQSSGSSKARVLHSKSHEDNAGLHDTDEPDRHFWRT